METVAVGEKESKGGLGRKWWGWRCDGGFHGGAFNTVKRLSAAAFSASVALAVMLICGSTRASGE